MQPSVFFLFIYIVITLQEDQVCHACLYRKQELECRRSVKSLKIADNVIFDGSMVCRASESDSWLRVEGH